jgi:hypothetical protein
MYDQKALRAQNNSMVLSSALHRIENALPEHTVALVGDLIQAEGEAMSLTFRLHGKEIVGLDQQSRKVLAAASTH